MFWKRWRMLFLGVVGNQPVEPIRYEDVVESDVMSETVFELYWLKSIWSAWGRNQVHRWDHHVSFLICNISSGVRVTAGQMKPRVFICCFNYRLSTPTIIKMIMCFPILRSVLFDYHGFWLFSYIRLNFVFFFPAVNSFLVGDLFPSSPCHGEAMVNQEIIRQRFKGPGQSTSAVHLWSHSHTLYEPTRSPVPSLLSNCRVMGLPFHHMLHDIRHMLGH